MLGLPSQFRILFWDTDIEKPDKKKNTVPPSLK
jgi:hypothetical protein